MKKIQLRLLVLTIAASIACAHSKLTLDLDLYGEDPSLALPVAPARLAGIEDGLGKAEAEAQDLVKERTDLSSELLKAYEAFVVVLTRARGLAIDDALFGPVEKQLADHLSALKKREASFGSAVDGARANLESYARRCSPNAPDRLDVAVVNAGLRKSLDQVGRALVALSAPLETPFEKAVVTGWPVIVRDAGADNVALLTKRPAEPADMAKLRATFGLLADHLSALDEKGRTRTGKLAAALRQGLAADGSPFVASITRLAVQGLQVPASMDLSNRGLSALGELLSSSGLFYSQVDWLQDPADPVWRVLSDPANDSRWRNAFAETYFYAEGNNSVVAVRDTPISFRVQRATNDPTNLVRGQLRVSRAIANAAVEIAGARMGLKPLPSPSTGDGAPSVQNPDDTPEALAATRATLSETDELRRRVVATLRTKLEFHREQLRQAQLLRTDKERSAATEAALSQLAASLEAYRAALGAGASVTPTSTPTPTPAPKAVPTKGAPKLVPTSTPTPTATPTVVPSATATPAP